MSDNIFGVTALLYLATAIFIFVGFAIALKLWSRVDRLEDELNDARQKIEFLTAERDFLRAEAESARRGGFGETAAAKGDRPARRGRKIHLGDEDES